MMRVNNIKKNICNDKEINGISLFSNVGIDETYFSDSGINIVGANEIIESRAKFYEHLYPNSQMVCGDITDKNIYNQLIEIYKKNSCEFLLATPPCQGMSVAGKMDENDVRNKLIMVVVDFIKDVRPKNIIIENVPGILNFSIVVDDKKVKIKDYIYNELEPYGYIINEKVLDAADFDTPQFRKRAIFLISKIKRWEFPKEKKHITVKDAIGDLPSLESGMDSGIKYHFSKKHNDKHILWMRHTPTGKTALDNDFPYCPNVNGRKIKGYSTTYKRIDWDRPAPTITMCNGGVSSQNNVHPGRKLKDGTYSDARVLTILELLRLTGLPDDWDIPYDASENLVRQVIGEAFPPKFARAMLSTMPKE